MEQEIQETKLNLEQYLKRTSKSDVSCSFNGSVESGQGTMTVESGFTVKDYKNITFTGNEGVYTINGNMTLQDGTSLLVALGREAGLA